MASKKSAKPARRQNVSASNYDPETKSLTVTFHSGKRYRYSDVEPDIADGYMNANSRGTYLHKHIAGKCTHCPLDD